MGDFKDWLFQKHPELKDKNPAEIFNALHTQYGNSSSENMINSMPIAGVGALTKMANPALGKVLSGVGQEIKNIAPQAIREAAAPELAALQAQKMNMAPSAYDAQKQAIFNKVRKMLGGE